MILDQYLHKLVVKYNTSLAAFSAEQQFLDKFVIYAKYVDERMRLAAAIELSEIWEEEKLEKHVFPGVVQRSDFWYLAQILPFEKHIHEVSAVHFDISTSKNISVIPLSSLIKEILFFIRKKDSDVLLQCERYLQKSSVTRNVVNEILFHVSKYCMQNTSCAPQFRLIRFDEYIRMWEKESLPTTFIEGYRNRGSQALTSFYCGSDFFGRNQFIDSIWNDFPLSAQKCDSLIVVELSL